MTLKQVITRLVVKAYGGDPEALDEGVRLQRERIKERERERRLSYLEQQRRIMERKQ